MHRVVGLCTLAYIYIYIIWTLWGKTLLQFSFSFVSFWGRIFTSCQQPKQKTKKKKVGKSGGANDTKDFILKRNETQVAIL
jgi:hypothetical protein